MCCRGLLSLLASPSSSHSSLSPWSYTTIRSTLLMHGTSSSSTKQSLCYVCCTTYSCSDEQCGSSTSAVSWTCERRTMVPRVQLTQCSIVGLSMVAFVVVTITCVTRAPHYQPSESVWVTFTNRSGWRNDGIVFLTGLLSPGYMYAGLDGAIHLAEESKNATVAIPRALFSTWIIGFVTSFAVSVATMYSAQDFEAIATTPTGYVHRSASIPIRPAR